MAFNFAGPELILMAGLTLLLAYGIVGTEEAFAGFSNPAVVTIAALFVVAQGMQETGATDMVARKLLGRPRFTWGAQLRMMTPVALMSSFVNNTPVVAMTVPIVVDWCRRSNLSASMLLLPVSYAAILGGTCSLIGTSTNLVVAGMAVARDPQLQFGMFDIAWIGLPALVTGSIYILITSRWLLKDRRKRPESLENPREYTVQMRLEAGSPILDKTIEEAGLRHLPGLFLVEIERSGGIMAAVSPRTVLRADDLLLFTGIIESVVDLRKIRGLVPATEERSKLERRPGRCLVEAVVSQQSPLVGQTIRGSRFRNHFDAVVIAVHRQGERIARKVGDICLEAGDVLLLETHPSFLRVRRSDGNFALVSEVAGSEEPRHERAGTATAVLLAMVVANVSGWVPLEVAALGGAGFMLITRCLTGQQAIRALDIRVLIGVAAAFGVGAALENSGVASALGERLSQLGSSTGPVGVLSGIYLVTSILAALVTTKVAAALIFPVAAAVAEGLALPMVPVCYVLMVASATAFSTPIGYPTNLMVYGPGGYRFQDFIKLGLPLQALIGVVTVSMTWWVWF
ncbi:MAG: SLC13 family permease [Myxococcota bacterium]